MGKRRKLRKDGLPKGTPRQYDIRTPERPRESLRSVAMRNARSQTLHEQMLGRALWERYDKLFVPQWAVSEFIVDFACPVLGIVIEVDGSSHGSERTRARDALQEAAVAAIGGITLRFTNDQVRDDLPSVMGAIHAVILSRLHLKATKKIHQLYGWRLPRTMRRELEAERDAQAAA